MSFSRTLPAYLHAASTERSERDRCILDVVLHRLSEGLRSPCRPPMRPGRKTASSSSCMQHECLRWSREILSGQIACEKDHYTKKKKKKKTKRGKEGLEDGKNLLSMPQHAFNKQVSIFQFFINSMI